MNHSSFRRGLIGAVLLCLVVTGYSLLRYPRILLPMRVGPIFLGVLVVVLLSYFILIWRLTRNIDSDSNWLASRGLNWGILIASFWLIEMITGNLVDAKSSFVRMIYFGSSGLAFLLPLFAGIWGAKGAGRIRAGMLVGLWSGIVSGLLAFLILMSITYLFLNIMLRDPQNVLQFQESGAADLVNFVIGDSLAGATGHLVIGLVLGPGLGLIGGVIGQSLSWKPATN